MCEREKERERVSERERDRDRDRDREREREAIQGFMQTHHVIEKSGKMFECVCARVVCVCMSVWVCV